MKRSLALRAAVALAAPWLTGCDGEGASRCASPEPGEAVFAAYCAPCHHPEGRGIERGPPPLVGSPWVAGSEGRLVRIVLHGVRGKIEVGERTYELEMPGFGRILRDAEVAAALSYVRRRFGGGDGSSSPGPISEETVRAVREMTGDRDALWTVDELMEVR